MSEEIIFFYVIQNEDFKDDRNKYYKYGITSDIESRINSYHTYSPNKFEYIKVYKLNVANSKFKVVDNIFSKWCKDINKLQELDKKLNFNNSIVFEKLNNYLLDKGGGIEYVYEEGLQYIYEIIDEEFDKFGIEVMEVYDENKIENLNNLHIQYIKEKKEADDDTYFNGFKGKMDTLRRYQFNCVFTLIHILLEYGAVYLELATGAGKTFITYNIFKHMNPKTIIIFSPLKKINNQNVSDKYLEIIGLNKYKIYKYSDKSKLKGFNKNEYNIIVCCSQSSDKLYNTLKKSILKNDLELFVWYDEAHWGFEEWLNEDNKDKYETSEARKFWLENTEIIKYRLFVSASPNKELVNENLNIFGLLYNPISYKELQEQGWVCPIIPKCFDCFIDNPLVNMSNFIINTFIDNNRNWGFSFHSEQVNAFNLFYKHYIKYKNEDTHIKPFLLIGDDFYTQFENTNIDKLKNEINDTINIDEKYKLQNKLDNILELKKKTVEVEKYFENKYNHKDSEIYKKQQYSIAYIVRQYSMGYDFKGIDYIIFPDTKTSFKDIIQSIGRGTRSDQLGEGGRNRNKELYFFIPVYFEDKCNINKEIKNRSEKNLIEVLSYLIYSYGMDVYEIAKTALYSPRITQNKSKELPIDGTEDIQTKFLDLLHHHTLLKQIKLKKLIQLLISNEIYNEAEYNEKRDTVFKVYKLKKNLHDYQDFCWQLVIDPSHTRYHKDKELCDQSKKNIFKINQNVLSSKDHKSFCSKYRINGWLELTKYDSKIPNYRNLDKFYP